MADESISVELSRYVTDIIGFLQQRTAQNDVIQFRLDWLCNAVVHYCNIPSREVVLSLIQEAKVLPRQNAKRFLQLLPKLGELYFVIKADFSSAQTSPL